MTSIDPNHTPIPSTPRWAQLRVAVLAVSAIAVAAGSVWLAQPFHQARPSPQDDAARFQRHLDARVPALLNRFGVPGVSIALVIDGKPAQHFVYGYADTEQQRPMSADTVFEVASISKSLTAWGVMKLVDAQQLALDAPIEQYIAPWPLPPAAFPSNQVTVRRLLNHTAGVNPGNLGVHTPDTPALSTRRVLLGEGTHPLVETAGPTRLEFPAGARFLYSNPGYTLLQLAIEQQTGRTYAAYMQQQVLQPLGMTSSSFDWDPPLRPRTATPYLGDGSATAITILNDPATGSLFSTAPDLARFVAAGMGVNNLPTPLLSPAAIAALYEPSVALPATEVQGLASDAGAQGHYIEHLADGHTAIMNGGFVPGWTSQFYLVPASGDGIVVLTNSDNGRAVIAEVVADWAAWRGLPALKMTRTYAAVGSVGPVVAGGLGLVAIWIGFGVLVDIAQRRRQIGLGSFHHLLRAIALLLIAGLLGYGWFGFARMIFRFGFPWLELPFTLSIVMLCVVLTVRAGLQRQPKTR